MLEDGILNLMTMHEVVLEEESVNEEEGVIKDEGYQSICIGLYYM